MDLYINNKIKNNVNKKENLDFIIVDNKKINEPEDIRNEFNKFFYQVGNNISKDISESKNNNISKTNYLFNNKTMYLMPTTYKEISKIISHLKDKSGRVDNIYSKILRLLLFILVCH